MGASFKKAGDVLESLSRVNWELLEAVLRLADDRKTGSTRPFGLHCGKHSRPMNLP